jgi:hypothetical protein
VRHPRREVFVGRAGRVMAAARHLAPAAVDAVMARNVDSQHLDDTPAAPTRGNLFEPMPEWARITGGWQARETVPRGGGAALAGAAALLLAAVPLALALGNGGRHRGGWLPRRRPRGLLARAMPWRRRASWAGRLLPY